VAGLLYLVPETFEDPGDDPSHDLRVVDHQSAHDHFPFSGR
jgi:hypothetical protein